MVISLDALNLVLHRLWEAGFFEFTVFDVGTVFEFAPGATIDNLTIRPELPPMLTTEDGGFVLTIASAYSDFLDVFYWDAVLDARFSADIGFRAATNADGGWGFEDVRVTDALLSLQPAGFNRSDYERVLDTVIKDQLEALFEGLLEQLALDPALPLVSGSDETAPLGLPVGSELALVITEVEPLDGAIGVRAQLVVQSQ